MAPARHMVIALSYWLPGSPAGLLAWFVEKYRAWHDCGGDPSPRFSDGFLLTQASLRWFTRNPSDVLPAPLRVHPAGDQGGGRARIAVTV
ncbi:hypothetical protein [Streptomyces paromomycinus]|uniref:Hydrolase n=1 Tax=Streptomyces paromomycinus TaxID=92743 RepID=A0A401WGC9_STREY|nr:hypothetical protein [Streptomyces paromomycinus]GCD48330.1 hydrolase [Streptomyces paromomycinus]